jgi:hypothetical protein
MENPGNYVDHLLLGFMFTMYFIIHQNSNNQGMFASMIFEPEIQELVDWMMLQRAWIRH